MYSPRNHLPTEPIHWSDATFAMWAAITTTVSSDVIDRPVFDQQSFLAINFISRAFLRRMKDFRRFRADEALLGTPNGAGSVYLLMQHKRALGFGTIVVFRDGPWEWKYVIVEVADLCSAWQRASGSFPTVIEGLRAVCQGFNDTLRTDLGVNGYHRVRKLRSPIGGFLRD